MRAHIRIAVVGMVAALAIVSTAAQAVSGGITGRTNLSGGAGCAGCHGSADATVTVAITGSNALNPSQGATYTITATKSGIANGTKMGIDIAGSDASPFTPIAGQCTNVSASELVHNVSVCALKTTSANSASYQFTYTMPAAAAVGSTHTIYGTSTLSFSGWNHAANFTVYTRPTSPTTVTPSNITSGSVNLAWTGGGPEYKVVYKTGAVAPANDTDGTQITLAAVNSTIVNGLSAATQYSFAVFSKLNGQTIFSTGSATTQATTTSLSAAARYVNAATGVNTGNCSLVGSPCKTITYAMSQAVAGNPGDLVSVAPGTYNVALGEVFPIIFKSGVQLVATAQNANSTVLDGVGDTVKQALITSNGNASPTARIEGFRFVNGVNQAGTNGVALGGAIYISGSSQLFTINRCGFDSNQALGYSSDGSAGQTGNLAWGGAVAIFGSVVNLTNNVFRSNTARGGNGFTHFGSPLTGNENGGPGDGGALYFAGTGIVTNNTFWDNKAIGGNGGGSSTGTGKAGAGTSGALSAGGNPAPTIINNVFAANVASLGTGTLQDPASAGAMIVGVSPLVTRNLFFGNLVNSGASTGDSLGTNAVQLDPQFFLAPDVQIRKTSPAAGAGTPTNAPPADFLGVARPNPPAIGAFEPRFVVTLLAVTSNANPSNFGQSVTLTATLTLASPGTATGTITFLDGATTLCAAVAVAAGQAQCTTAALSGGAHSVTASYSGNTAYSGSSSVVFTQNVAAPDPPRLANISTRGQVLTGNDRMIAGFIIGGAVPKTVVINVAGPSLNQYGLAGLANPTLELVRSSDQFLIATNDNWQTQTVPGDELSIQSAGFQPNHVNEPAIIATLNPGAYTAIVSGVNSGTGVGLVGVFEADHPEIPLVNISTRGQVLLNNDVMIAGFIVQGSGSQKVVVNVAGPSLNQYGLAGLANPTLTLVRSSDQSVVAVNDNWQTQTNPGDVALIQATGFQPNHANEPAIIVTLPPGGYTAIVSGVSGTTGVGLVGVFTAP